MIGRMGRVVGSALLATLVAAVLIVAPVAAQSEWMRLPGKWSDKTGTAFTGSAKDTTFITDENDSTRTDEIDTATWDWNAFHIAGASSGAIVVAHVEIAANLSNGAADTTYFTIEKKSQARNLSTGAAMAGKWTYNATMAAAAGACAVLQGVAQAGQALYRGVLLYDPDTQPALNTINPGDIFRLVVKGDQGGTTPKLSGCRITITAPIRQARR